jgi:hypothetical protein
MRCFFPPPSSAQLNCAIPPPGNGIARRSLVPDGPGIESLQRRRITPHSKRRFGNTAIALF